MYINLKTFALISKGFFNMGLSPMVIHVQPIRGCSTRDYET